MEFIRLDQASSLTRSSPFGDLDGASHAVVLVAYKAPRSFVLDPYFTTASQPILRTRDELAAAWTGEVLFG